MRGLVFLLASCFALLGCEDTVASCKELSSDLRTRYVSECRFLVDSFCIQNVELFEDQIIVNYLAPPGVLSELDSSKAHSATRRYLLSNDLVKRILNESERSSGGCEVWFVGMTSVDKNKFFWSQVNIKNGQFNGRVIELDAQGQPAAAATN